MTDRPINQFPPHRRGLWRVRAVPYLLKEAEYRQRWRALKRRDTPAPALPTREERRP